MDCTPCPQSPSHAAPAVGAATSGKPADLSAGPGIPGLKEAGEVGLGQESTGRPGQGLGGSAACSSHPKPAGYLHGAELSLGLPGRLHTLNLHLPSGPSGVVLSLSMSLTSLEFHAVSGRKPGMLASNVFPVLQTLTLKGWGLQLGTWNVTKIDREVQTRPASLTMVFSVPCYRHYPLSHVMVIVEKTQGYRFAF